MIRDTWQSTSPRIRYWSLFAGVAVAGTTLMAVNAHDGDVAASIGPAVIALIALVALGGDIVAWSRDRLAATCSACHRSSRLYHLTAPTRARLVARLRLAGWRVVGDTVTCSICLRDEPSDQA